MTTIVGYVDVCPECAAVIDPDHYTEHVGTGEKYCSGRCWAEGVID